MPSRTVDPKTLLAEVLEAVRLQEGAEGVAQVIRVIGAHEKITLKDLAAQTRLPVPVLSALRGEMEARGILARNGGLTLTPLGHEVLTSIGGAWIPSICDTCGGAGIQIPDRYVGVLSKLQQHWRNHPGVDVQLDQSYALPESNLRRCLFALEHGGLLGKRVLFLGDDDCGSCAVGLIGQELGSRVSVTALDVDRGVLRYIRSVSSAEDLRVETIEHDVRKPLPNALAGRFDTVFTDPPYTLPGLELFVSRALEATGSGAGRQIFLSFGSKPPATGAKILRVISSASVALQELRPGFNRYEGASAIGNSSDLYHLIVTYDSTPTLHGNHHGALYTGEVRPRTRQYKCKACHRAFEVGVGQTWATIEILKHEGCPYCGAHGFEQVRRPAMHRQSQD